MFFRNFILKQQIVALYVSQWPHNSIVGLIPRAIVHIFEGKEAEEDDDTMFDVRVSYIEIYNEEIRDLLGDDPTKKLEIKVRAKYHQSF